MSADPDSLTTTTQDRRWRWVMWVLRNVPVVLLLMLGVGVALTVSCFGIELKPLRKDGFAILPERRQGGLVQRVDLPPGWRLEFVRTKQAYMTGVFAPDGTFAFRVAAVAPTVYLSEEKRFETYSTLDRFAEVRSQQPRTTVERRTVDGVSFAVARQDVGNSWLPEWDRGVGDTATELTFFAERCQWCLRFDIPPDRVARFEPEAEKMFLSARVIPSDDPRADNTDPDAVTPQGHPWSAAAGLTLLVAVVALFFPLVWLALVMQVWLCATGRLPPRPIPPPEPPKPRAGKPTPPDPVGEAEAALAGLGFQRAGWFALDDAEGLRVSAWWHPERLAAAFVITAGGAARVRFVTRFDRLWLVTTSRQVDLGYRPPPGVYLQMKRGTAGELWAWHLEAEALFAEHRVKPSPPSPDPMGVYVELRHLIARHHASYTLWFVRYELCTELCRMAVWLGKSVRWQVERGWVPDPATAWVGGLDGGLP